VVVDRQALEPSEHRGDRLLLAGNVSFELPIDILDKCLTNVL
jgi:hypothetical protein